jgi:serine/threonine protein kinase
LERAVSKAREVGRGGSGVVFLGDGTETVIKKIECKNEDDMHKKMLEAKIMQMLNHPNAVRLIRQETTGLCVFLEMPYYAGGSCKDLLDNKHALHERDIIRMLAELLGVLWYLHEGILVVHRDIKPGNLMRRVCGSVVLVDYGIAVMRSSGAEHPEKAGTITYFPPELFESNRPRVQPPADVFSSMWTVLTLYAGCVLRKWNSPLVLYNSISSLEADEYTEYEHMYLVTQDRFFKMLGDKDTLGTALHTQDFSEALRDIFVLGMEKVPEKRLSARELYEHMSSDTRFKHNG